MYKLQTCKHFDTHIVTFTETPPVLCMVIEFHEIIAKQNVEQYCEDSFLNFHYLSLLGIQKF